MRFWPKFAAVAAACLAAASAAALAATERAGSSAVARPAVSKISPATAATGQRIIVSGWRFMSGKHRNSVVFLGRRGQRDDVSVRATTATARKIALRAPSGAPSGRVQVVNRLGKSAPSKRAVTFDDDRDGLSNEREGRLGTNPLNRDTDGDGVLDGDDGDPLHAPGGAPAPDPGPVTPAVCPAIAVAGPGAGPASSFTGLENVIGEGRALISHSAQASWQRYCLYRKRRSQPDSDYQLVGSETDADKAIRDGQRPNKSEDYIFRTDAVTASGVVAGSNTVGARGAGGVGNADGWSDINQTCIGCGGASVQGGVLRASARGTGTTGPAVGQTVVYKQRFALQDTPTQTDEWVTRVLTPLSPSATGSYVSASLTMSEEHPAVARDDGVGTVADVTRSSSDKPFINLELRAQQDGELRVIVRDSNTVTPLEYTNGANHDLRADFGVIGNAYLVLSAKPNGKYTAGVSLPSGDNVDVAVDRAMPGGMTNGWLSLRTEQSSEEAPQSNVSFQEAWVTVGGNTVFSDDFGGVNGPIQAPVGFTAQQVAGNGAAGVTGDLNSPSAIEFAPGGDMFIAERGGRIFRRPAAGGALDEVLDIRGDIVSMPFADQGLLGFALDPGFVGDGGTNDWAYIYYTVEPNPSDPDNTVRTVARVQRVKFNGTDFVNGTRETLVGTAGVPPGTSDTCPPATTSDCLPSDAYTHTAGGLEFGVDGKLWISVPDGADPDPGSGDPLARRVQNPNSLAGKLLRVEPATGKAVASNPGYTDDASSRTPVARTWVRGFRNPFRIAQRPGGTNAWYLTDVGWDTWEEVNAVPNTAGTFNYGWPCFEGPERKTQINYITDECQDEGLFTNHNAVHYYASSPSDHAVIGGGFYTGSSWPAPWKPAAGHAAFYYSDYPTGEVYRLETDADDVKVGNVETFAAGFTGPVEVTEGPADLTAPGNGEKAIYVVNIGDVRNPSATDGKVWRITQASP